MSKYNNRTIRVTLTLLVVFVVSSDFLNVFVTAKATDCQEESDDRSNKCHTIENQTSQTSSSSLQDVTLHTSKPAPKPKSLNMLAEDQLMDTAVFRPTPVPLMSAQTKDNITSKPIDNPKSNNTKLTYEEPEPKGRALNFTIDEQSSGNVLSNSTANHHDDFDLSDVTIRDDEDDDEMFSAKILAPNNIHRVNTTLGICEKGGLTYENGEKLEIGCDSICTCLNGKMDCTDRCFGPLFRKGKKNLDPLCITKDSDDPCCSVLLCAGDTETEPLEMCLYENKTYNRGDKFNKGCLEVCTCEIAGKLSCKPRCSVPKKTSDRCVEVPDPKDSCCKQVLCDVSLDDHEHDLKDEELKETKTKLKLTSAKYVNSSAILLSFDSELDNNNLPIVEVSNDKHDWSYYKMLPNGYLFVRDVVKYLRLENTDDVIEVKNDNFSSEMNDKQNVVSADDGCVYKGKTFLFGQEHNDECESLCVCQKNGMKCLKLECPTYFGVDVLDPNCIEWETIPPNFQPKSPDCCPEKIQCKNNGSCEYEGQTYKNWEQLPINVTGCDKRCYCEMGKVECQNSCPPVTALPPPTLPCSPSEASVAHTPDDDCCMYWVCTKQESTSSNNTIIPKDSNKDQLKNNKIQTTTIKPPIKTSTAIYVGPFATTKSPSKLLGPLSVYANQDEGDDPNNDVDSKLPHISSPFENPFYHISQMNTEYKGPLNPHFPNKNKNQQIFVKTPLSSSGNNVLPNKDKFHKNKLDISQYSTESNINMGNGQSDLLSIIQNHPELSNLPHGSVLEIHSVSANSDIPSKNKHLFEVNGKPVHPGNSIVPYAVPQPQNIPISGQNYQHEDVSIEDILQELHKAAYSNGHPQISQVGILPNLVAHNTEGYGSSNSKVQVPFTKTNDSRVGFMNSGGFANNFPGPFPNHPGFQQPQDDITVHTLEPVDSHTVRLAFMVPPVIVGLHGRVEVRYTHDIQDDDVSSWNLQVFAPPNDLIATPTLEFDLLDLKADTEYRIKITITLRDLQNTPTSRIYKIKTLKEVQTSTTPPVIPIEPDLSITDINATWVTVMWRKFNEYELQFIDGVQLRFKEIEGKIYAATPLIHRAVTSYTLENLKSNTKYEIGIYFIPFPGQQTELHAKNLLHFSTANEIDTYGFSVSLEISQIKSTSVEISWAGVPYPEDKYVNIYRAIYQSDSGKEDHSTFKIAKRDSPTKSVIMDLKPGTRYRLWLEVYLTNGKIKTSNVQDFVTKPRVTPALGSTTSQDKLSRAELLENGKGDYYGPLVIVGILAALAILSTLILLMILVKRHNQNKAAITPPSTRISQSAYDNPTYKVEIQQETMGL